MLSKRIFVLVSLLLVLFLLVGCGTIIPPIGNEAPVITSDPVTEAEVGILYTYDVDAYDPDGDALTYSLTRNPSGMVIDEYTGVITWEYPTVGSFGVTVKVSDGVLSDTQSFTITIALVAEFTEIVVTPDTMALEVGETGTFEVIAHYSFGPTQDVTTDCVYTLTTPNAGVITVEAPLVTADGVGTDTIFISYTENGVTATANILVMVSGVRIPMEIIVDLPIFTVGGPYWFTVTMIANDDLGESVKASFGWPTSEGVPIAGILETDVGSDLTFALEGDVFRTDPFAMEDTTVNFRGTFTSPGTYLTTIEVKTTGGILLCSEGITIIVEGDPLAVGDIYGGGIVAYTDGTGHGLIAATEDATLEMAWITGDDTQTTVNGNTFTDYGTGATNTAVIIAQAVAAGNSDLFTYAAGVCDDYTNADTGTGEYDDWFLPSKDELNLMYTNLHNITIPIGGFADVSYWSSSENDANNSWCQTFDSGAQSFYIKNNTQRVRPVRYF